jgi:integrase
MKGSIRTRMLKDGTKAYDVLYRAGAKQRGKTFSRKKDAEHYLTKTVGSIHDGTYRALVPCTVRAFATRWVTTLGNVKPHTARTYRSILERHLLPRWGSRLLHSLTTEDINVFLGERAAAGRKPKTLRNEVGLISKFLSDAKEARHLIAHPLIGSRSLQRPRALTADAARPEIEPFTPTEIGLILDVIEPGYATFVLTGFSTGARLGELAALQWQDVDPLRHQLHVRRTFWAGRDYTPKTRASIRGIDVGAQLLAALSALRRERFGETVPPPTDPVFLSPDGERIDLEFFRKGPWTRALAKAGIAYRKPYSMRHTFATLLLSQGQSVVYVSRMLGHASAKMTLDTYAKFLPTERIEAPGRLEAQLAAARSTVSTERVQ